MVVEHDNSNSAKNNYLCILKINPMNEILKVNTPDDFLSYVGAQSRHPLVGVIDFEKVSPIPSSVNSYKVYGLFMHNNIPNDLTYGCGTYDYRSGTLICVAPGQIGGREESGALIELDGWALLFHPDLIKGTHLEKEIRDFTFFDYQVNEALHMSEGEKSILATLMRQIQTEIENGEDASQKNILIGYITAMLNYCQRFYNRQFQTRKVENSDILMRFNAILTEYFESDIQLDRGLPGVQYFADKMNMSPNYFSDVIKRYTGENPSNIIREYVMRLAKNALKSSGNIAQVAYSLGFEYPQHFTRMFKKQTGITPKQYLKNSRLG